jgi:hypothetical protein
MKKVIRLTESDLIKIVNKIILEQNDPSSPSTSTDKYQERIKDTGKTFKFQQVSKELMPKYLQWYQGSSYPEIQEYISKTYGIPRLFDPKSLETAGKGNTYPFKQFLNAVKSSLTAAAKDNYNGYVFGKNYDFAKLGDVEVMGDKLDSNWMSTLENTLPIIGTLPEFKKFVSKVISSRRKAIGLKD